jgi:hypothetical protein
MGVLVLLELVEVLVVQEHLVHQVLQEHQVFVEKLFK